MAWLRIDDRVRTHPKIAEAGPAAAWLWFCGICYCREHLTDGAIPKSVLTSLAMNLPQPVKHAERLVAVGLWHEAENSNGYTVHDFLEWNPSRAEVETARRADLERKRNKNGVQIDSERNPIGIQTTASRAGAGAPARAISSVSSSVEESARETTDEEAQRAGRFLECYQTLYARARHGAHYPLKPNRDYLHAVGLVKAYKDDARLEKMAELYLLRTDREVDGKARTVGEFAHMAPWCDGRLREAGL